MSLTKNKPRFITYCKAINEAITSQMKKNKNIVVYGIEDKMFGSNDELLEKFGNKRFFYTPLSEDMLTGFSLGLALSGKIPIFNHIRVDFLLLGMNQLINMISSYSFASNNKVKVPMLIRAVIGRGWGQGYQHSKSLQSIFAHIPGLKVIMPSTPYDAKGMISAALKDGNPVICLEHRWLYWQKGQVPKKDYVVPLDEPKVLRKGHDLTILCLSWMNVEACQAADYVKNFGISCEIIDVRSLTNLKKQKIFNSIKKTKRCIIADYDWIEYGASAELSDYVYSNFYKLLKSPIKRMGFKFSPCPTGRDLENAFYPNSKDIVKEISKIFRKKIIIKNLDIYSHEKKFKGPF
jgi:acetoin:2,6-dichlorophenolindophenol oxidoreductase subunit beta